jgi:hypothetical protein
MMGWVKKFGIIIITLIVIGLSLIGPIDRTALTDQKNYQDMKTQLDSLTLEESNKNTFETSWDKVSITPSFSMKMAGYTIREKFENVHDSLFARVILIRSNNRNYYLITVDLLVFPPALKDKLSQLLQQENKSPFLYLSATHTHNGVGEWHNSMAGNFILGQYNEAWIDETAQKIFNAMTNIEGKLRPSTISYWQADAIEFVENRLKPGAPYDGIMRGFKLTRNDSSTAQVITFSAHATSITKKSRTLSGDYPAVIIDNLNNRDHSFGMFMAGMVGSHRLAGFKELDFELIEKAGEVLTEKIESAKIESSQDSIKLSAVHIPIQFGASQLRIAKNWKVRDWAFSNALSPLQGELTFLEINDIVMIGTPCDFSGEIYVKHLQDLVSSKNKKLLITSFNGDYNGYITEDEHYETLEKEEVMGLNWVGPYYGQYFTDVITTLLNK